MKNLPYCEGSVFLVPLDSGGYARGVVSRFSPNGRIVFGYFFGLRIEYDSNVSFSDLKSDKAVLCIRFGDLGLIEKIWPIVGRIEKWDRTDWPMMDAIKRDVLGIPKPVLVRYDDDDPSRVVAQAVLDKDLPLPTDGLAGYGFVEAVLSKKLA